MIKPPHLYQKQEVITSYRALILGKKIDVEELCFLLQNNDYKITFAESSEELARISAIKQPFKLVVMTDSFTEAPDVELINYIKQRLNPGKIICLSISEDPEKEKLLRSLGLIFFGSYERFSIFAEKTVNQIRKVPEQIANEEVKKRKMGSKKSTTRVSAGSTELLGISFERATLFSATTQILNAGMQKKKGLIVTPNVDHIVMLQDDAEMRLIYQNALFRYADGMPIVWLSRILKSKNLPERVTGADLLITICEKAAKTDLNIYFLGGNPGIAQQAAKKLQAQFHGLKISGICCPPFGFENDPVETDFIIDNINSRNVDILFIGVGAPKQEKWAAKHIDRLHVGPVLCIGAAFDFAAGIIKRAPLWVQKSGFEWVWRLASEPGRMWKRYLVRDSRFIPLAIKEISKSMYTINSSKI